MLERIELRDFAIVDELAIDLEAGLNVLTGETGAGKSIVVDGLSVLVGGRPDAAMIRTGSTSALIQGVFRDAGVGSAGRRLVRDGRNTARIDGELVSVAELADRGGAEVAIFGQHASQRLVDASAQRDQLDRLLSAAGRAASAGYREAFEEYRGIGARLHQLQEAQRERARQLDMLRFQRDEIDEAALSADEEERLEQEARGLRNAERIVTSVAKAVELLATGDPNAAELLAAAQREAESAGRFHDEVAILADELAEVVAAAQAVGAELEAFLEDFETDAARLDAIEMRISLVERLKRKYGASVAEVLAYRERIGAELAELEADETDLGRLEHRLETLAAELERTGRELSIARHEAGKALAEGVGSLLPRLAMPDARFETALEPVEDFGPHGREKIRFLFSANRGEPLAPLASVASGGELSRLMLAIHVVSGTDVPTVVFDEVDAGIGGQTARAVGELLRRMAAERQVLVVTHLPQVAAYADAHFAVSKRERDGRTVTRVERLEAPAREAELARMLSGQVTDASLRNARELVDAAAARV